MHLYGSACFFVFAAIYWLVVGSAYMAVSNCVFGALSALNWFAFRRALSGQAAATTFLAIVYLGLLNVVVHMGVHDSPLAYWGLSVAVAAAFTYTTRGIVAWTLLCLLFFPLSLQLKRTVLAARAIPLDAAQSDWLNHASYFGILLFLGYTSYLFRAKLARAFGDLAQSEAKYRSLFEAERDALVVYDPQALAILDVNPAFTALYGWTHGEATALTLRDLCPEAGAAGPDQLHVRKDGTVFRAEITPSVFTREGRPAALWSVRDVSERRRAEEERERLFQAEKAARAEASRANLAKDVFLATLSHELRTPLAAIQTWAQLLRMRKVEGETARRGLEMIEASARAQGRLVNDLLDVSRIVTGKLQLEVQDTDPAAVVREVVDSVGSAAGEKGLRLEVDVDPQAPRLRADPLRLRQVVSNLVSNAIKFSTAGGRVGVRLERAGDGVRLAVADEGCGIEPAALERIFDPFTQADGSTTRGHGGLGLGLSIARTLVEMHGGTIRARSEGPGRGALFTVELPPRPPAAGDAAGPPPPAAVSADGALRGMRVVLVDDEAASREALAQLLRAYEAEVRCAGSAAEALKTLAEWPPDVLVTDLAMPGEDGYSLVRRLRTEAPEALRRLPAVAVTAHAAPEEARRALAAGFQAHLVKPVDAETLVGAVAASARPR